ncbi:MAG TPA: CDP-alcohol phosphatidyltransferase family protein [Candidatus Limnocylindria bacterium]
MSDDRAPRGDALLSARLKEAGRVAVAPVVNVLAAAGVSPNSVTVSGLILVAAASLLVWQRSLLLGAVFLAVGASLDAIDGGLARAQGGATPFGAFLDSTLDRTGEALVYLGIVAFWLDRTAQPFVPVMLAALALSGSFLVSYSRARAEAVGFTASNGWAPRPERLIILVLGLALAGLGHAIALIAAMGVIAILAWVTVAQRIWNVRQQAASAALPAPIGQDKES